jgi:hypothetical protein
VALIEGALNVFFNLAETAALTRVVSREQIPAATTLNEITLSTGSMLGPAFGGLIFAIGQGFAFLADAVSYRIFGVKTPPFRDGDETSSMKC